MGFDYVWTVSLHQDLRQYQGTKGSPNKGPYMEHGFYHFYPPIGVMTTASLLKMAGNVEQVRLPYSYDSHDIPSWNQVEVYIPVGASRKVMTPQKYDDFMGSIWVNDDQSMVMVTDDG